MRVLVTGATGFIGRHVAAALRRRGDEVRALARSTTHAWKTHWLEARGAAICFGDIRDAESLIRPMKDVDAVVHCAAWVRLGPVDADHMNRVNVHGTENVLSVARDLDVPRVVHLSSIAALAHPREGTVDEDLEHTGDYTSDYERTKHIGTLIADDHARRGLHVVQAMPSVVFGRRDPNFGQFFKAFARRRIRVLPAPETVIPLVHVEDLAAGILLALDDGRRGERFLFNQSNHTLGELFERLESATGIRSPRVRIPTPIARTGMRTAHAALRFTPWRERLPIGSGTVLGKTATYDAGRAQRRLDWMPQDFDARWADTARWYAHYYGKGSQGPPPIGADGVDPATLPGDASTNIRRVDDPPTRT